MPIFLVHRARATSCFRVQGGCMDMILHDGLFSVEARFAIGMDALMLRGLFRRRCSFVSYYAGYFETTILKGDFNV